MLSVGDRAPDFDGTDQRGQRLTLDGLLQRGVLVLYFYPRDFTRVCTQQACLFRDAHEALAARGVNVVGVSLDGPDRHERFAAKHSLPFSLLPDPDKRISRAYGALQVLGLFTKRVTYVIDRDKVVRGVFHHELSATKHLADIERLLSELDPAPAGP